MAQNNWRTPQTFEDLLLYIDKRLGSQERRASPTSAAELLGPGAAARAIQIGDWNETVASFNGNYYSEPGALHGPDQTHRWTGRVTARADNSGIQEVWNVDDLDEVRYFMRTYQDDGTGQGRQFTDWRKFATPSGYIEFNDLDPDFTTQIQNQLNEALDGLDLIVPPLRVFRQTEPPVGTAYPDRGLLVGDQWIDTNNANKPYLWDGTSWIAYGDSILGTIPASIATVTASVEAAAQAAEDAQADADAAAAAALGASNYAKTRSKVFRQAAAPSNTGSVLNVGDTWFDTDDRNRIYTWSGSAWVEMGIDTVFDSTARLTAAQAALNATIQTAQGTANQALADAADAEAVADGKARTFFQTAAPTGLVAGDVGDMWFDTDDQNKMYRWSGTAWVLAQDGGISAAAAAALAAQNTANSRITTWYQTSAPSATAIGDLWVDTDDGNRLYRASALGTGGWVSVRDTTIATVAASAAAALSAAQTAQTAADAAAAVADGAIRTYYDANQPWGNQALSDPNMTTVGWNSVTYSSGVATINATGAYSPNVTAAVGKTVSVRVDLSNPTAAAIVATLRPRTTINSSFTGGHQGTDAVATIPPGGTATLTGEVTVIAGENGSRIQMATGVGLRITRQALIVSDATTLPAYPVTDAALGDMWFDSDDGQAYRWNGSQWQVIEDSSIGAALAAAQGAQATADGRVAAYYSAAQPWPAGNTTHDADVGDLWFDTANGNRAYFWNGSRTWELVQTAAITQAANTAQSNAIAAAQADTIARIATARTTILSDAAVAATALATTAQENAITAAQLDATQRARLAESNARLAGSNMFIDPGCQDPTKWTFPSRFSIDTSVGAARSGTGAIKASSPGTSGQSLNLVTGADTSPSTPGATIPVIQGQVWRFRAWAKVTADYNGNSDNGKMRLGNQAGTILAARTWGDTDNMGANAGTYALREMVYTVPAGTTALYVSAVLNHTVGSLWIDDIEAVNISGETNAIAAAALDAISRRNEAIATAQADTIARIGTAQTAILSAAAIDATAQAAAAQTAAQTYADNADDVLETNIQTYADLRNSKISNPSRTGVIGGWTPGSGLAVEDVDFNGITVKALRARSTGSTSFLSETFGIDATKGYQFRFFVKDPTENAGTTTQFQAGVLGLDPTNTSLSFTQVPYTTGIPGSTQQTFIFGSVTAAQANWTEWVAYVFPQGAQPSDMKEVGGGSPVVAATRWNALVNPAMTTLRFFFRNYDNAGVARDLWVYNPTVTEVSLDEIRSLSIVQQWTYTGTVEMDGGNLRADTVGAGAIIADAITSKHTLTGPTIQTTSTASRGIKITSSGLTVYSNGAAGLPAAGTGMLVIDAAGNITMRGSLTSGSTITGATIVAGTYTTQPEANRGITMSSGGMTAYDSLGNLMMTLDVSTGSLTMKGSLLVGSTVPPSSLPVLGGGNALTNSNFQNPIPLTGWIAGGTGNTIAANYTPANSHNRVVSMGVTGGTGPVLYRDVDVYPGTTYTLSAYLVPTASTPVPYLRTHDTNSVGIKSTVAVNPVAGVMQRIVHTFVGAANGRARLHAYGPGYFSDFQLEEGEVASAYAPKADELLPGSIDGFVITGALVQTRSEVQRGVKITSSGVTVYSDGSAGLPAAGTGMLVIDNAGNITMRGSLTSGSTITGATIVAGTYTTQPETNRGVTLSSGGMTAYDQSGNLMAWFNVATGTVQIKGSLLAGSVVPGSVLPFIGGTNELLNSSFEDWPGTMPTSWTNSVAVVAKSTAYVTGTQSLSLTGTTAASNRYVYQRLPSVLPNTKYTLSFMRQVTVAPTAAQTSNRFAILYDGPTNATIANVTGNTPTATGIGTWVREQVTITTGATPDYIEVRLYSGVNAPILYDSVQLELGEVATSYSPKVGEILPGSVYAAMLDADAINGKVITGATVRTSLNATVNGVVMNTNGLYGFGGSAQKFFLRATDGLLLTTGNIQTLGQVNGALVTGGTVQTQEEAQRGIKMTSTALIAYGPTAANPAVYEAKVTIDTATGLAVFKGGVMTGGTLSGGYVNGAVVQTSPDPAVGVKMTTGGILAYDASGSEVFNLSAATGNVTLTGSIIGSSFNGGSVTGATVQTDDAPALGVKINTNGFVAFGPVTPGSTTYEPKVVIDAKTGVMDAKGKITATGLTVLGGMSVRGTSNFVEGTITATATIQNPGVAPTVDFPFPETVLFTVPANTPYWYAETISPVPSNTDAIYIGYDSNYLAKIGRFNRSTGDNVAVTQPSWCNNSNYAMFPYGGMVYGGGFYWVWGLGTYNGVSGNYIWKLHPTTFEIVASRQTAAKTSWGGTQRGEFGRIGWNETTATPMRGWLWSTDKLAASSTWSIEGYNLSASTMADGAYFTTPGLYTAGNTANHDTPVFIGVTTWGDTATPRPIVAWRYPYETNVVVRSFTATWSAYDTSGGRVFSAPLPGETARGMAYDGADLFTFGTGRRVFKHGRNITSEYGRAAYTWYDGNNTSPSILHETMISPPSDFVRPPRWPMRITTPTAPQSGQVDANAEKANQTGLYLAVGTSANYTTLNMATTAKRQTQQKSAGYSGLLAGGVTDTTWMLTEQVTTTGSVPPAANGFLDVSSVGNIRSQTVTPSSGWDLRGDGTASIGHMNFGADGQGGGDIMFISEGVTQLGAANWTHLSGMTLYVQRNYTNAFSVSGGIITINRPGFYRVSHMASFSSPGGAGSRTISSVTISTSPDLNIVSRVEIPTANASPPFHCGSNIVWIPTAGTQMRMWLWCSHNTPTDYKNLTIQAI